MSENTKIDEVNKGSGEKAWEYLPNILPELSKYSFNSDLIQLSQACKIYRNQLRPIIFKTLTLFKHPTIALKMYKGIPERRAKLEAVINDMKRSLGDGYSLVKKINIRTDLPQYFIQELFEIFKDVESVKILEYKFCRLSAVFQLKQLKRLNTGLVFDDIRHNELTLLKNLLDRMDSLDITAVLVNPYWHTKQLLIDTTFTNLKSLVTNRVDIFSSFPIHLPSLVEISLYRGYHMNFDDHLKLSEFFNINPQLKKINIAKHLFNKAFRSIFNLSNLKYLKINYRSSEEFVEYDGIENLSIEHIYINQYYGLSHLNVFLNCCKNIRIVEFGDYQPNDYNDIKLKNERLINLLIINDVHPYKWGRISPLPLLNNFSVVKFNKGEFKDFRKQILGIFGWKLMKKYPGNAKEFCIQRT